MSYTYIYIFILYTVFENINGVILMSHIFDYAVEYTIY